MNFEKAYRELLQGKNIRRKAWEPLMCLSFVDGSIRAFRGEHSNFYGDLTMLMAGGWKVLDGDNKEITFIEAIEELKNKKWITNVKWGDHIFIFVDGEKLAICKPVEYDFMPSFKCFCSQDWEVMK
jgi:hypothetical protein